MTTQPVNSEPPQGPVEGRGVAEQRATECAVEGCVRPIKSRQLCRAHYHRLRLYGDPLADGIRRPAREFFEANVGRDTTECIVWPFSLTPDGYGVLREGGRQARRVGVHRLACERAYGPRPPNTDAAHLPGVCHNPACFNPRHLRWATRAGNLADRVIDGTMTRGRRNGSAKLTESDVIEIREAVAQGVPQYRLARRYGVSPTAISDIVRRKHWAWL